MFTAKMMYCLWVTLAQDDDNFVLETTRALPKKYKKMSEKQQKEFIRERILGKSNEELVKVQFFNDACAESRSECFEKKEFTKHYVLLIGRVWHIEGGHIGRDY